MKKLAVFSILGLTITMVNCKPKKAATSPEPSATMTKAMAQKQYSADQLEAGHALYKTNCGNCHKLYKTEDFNEVRWNRILNSMIPKTNISTADAALLRAFVIANATEAK